MLKAGSVEIRGTVFKVERLAVHDGPGIRTVVFLKGCPLRCRWCAAPESQASAPELLIDPERCVGCGACVEACPAGAVSIDAAGAVRTDRSRCEGCGACVRACPSGARAISGRTVTLVEILAEINNDEVFYHRSGGGVTVSGGEPLAQPEFTRAILTASARLGRHTAVETCGLAPWDTLASILPVLDLIFFDLKHIDPRAHRDLTGAENRLILENLKKIGETAGAPPVVVRIPLVPGLTDTPENIDGTGQFLAGVGGVERVEILPYHRYGVHGYGRLGREYDLAALQPPSADHLTALTDRIAGLSDKC